MNQIAFNALAITVFALTMFGLIGPMVNISPVYPAIATFGLLGLYTLDNFGWQGKGSTILLDWLAALSPEHRSRVVRHEAGHFLVARLLDIPVSGYALTAWESLRQGYPGQGGVQFADERLNAQVRQGQVSGHRLNQYCTVWMAGIAAETLVYDDAQGGGDDRRYLQSVLAQLRFPIEAIPQRERWATLQAKTLLQAHWSAYEALVEAMESRASVEECDRAIAQSANSQGQS